jgi:hypothetical protein
VGLLDFWRRGRQEPTQAGVASAERPVPILVAVDDKGNHISLAHLMAAVSRPTTTGSEYGATGTPVSGVVIGADDYNRELQGKNAIVTYDKMRRGDAQVAAVLKMVKLPLMGADWDFVPPEDGDATDEEIAAYCKSVLIDAGALKDGWPYTLRHILLFFDFGYTVLEKVWEVGPDGKLRYHRLAPRLAPSIEQFRIDAATGDLAEIVQRAVKNGVEQELVIPAEYAAVFVHEREGDNYNGISLLRPIFKHWYYKDQLYNIDAIGHERLGVGIPMAELEDGAPRGNKEMAATEEVLEGIRSHHRSYIIAVPHVRFKLLQSQKENTSLMKSVEHHDVMIARAVLAPFLNVGQAQHGTRSSTVELADVFFNSLEAVATSMANDAHAQIVKPLCDLNWPMEGRKYPRLVARNIRNVDPQLLAETLKAAVEPGVLTVTDDIENMFREVMGWDPLPESMRRPTTRVDPMSEGNSGGGGNPPAGGGSNAPAPEDAPVALSAHVQGTPLRQPTAFEERVFSLAEIPRRLDYEIMALGFTLTNLRHQQVRDAAKELARLDAASPDRSPFSRLRPQDFRLKHEGAILAALKKAQQAVAEYGAEQVRLELRRQGAPIELSLDTEDDKVLMLDEVTARAGMNSPSSVRTQLATSARATSDALNAQMRSVLLQEAVRLRRTGLTGDALESAIVDAVLPSAARNVATPVRGEVHEAFALGRSAEAARNRDRIAYAVYSAVLDNRTCSPCGSMDSQMFEMGTEEQVRSQPPYVHCVGKENCRCVQLYVYSGGGD